MPSGCSRPWTSSARIVGVSMGGMIAQTVAIRHPQRTLSLTSIMATPAPYIGPPTPRAQAVLLMPPPADREEAGRRALEVFRVIGSPPPPGVLPDHLYAKISDAFARFDPVNLASSASMLSASPI